MTTPTTSVRLASFLGQARVLVVTGAGVSTDSGVPDYRGSGAPEAPSIEYDDFVSSAMWRRFLWERNEESWRILEGVSPTGAHRALASLERSGHVVGIATQNVDRLHTAAGSRNVAEMHGRFDQAVCIACGAPLPRAELSDLFAAANPGVRLPARALADIEILPPKDTAAARSCTWVVPPCPRCGGILKPDVVFFGEALPQLAMARAYAMARDCDVVLAVGTSLVVSTAMWVVGHAREHGARFAIINRGPTAADADADLRVEGGASEVLFDVARALG